VAPHVLPQVAPYLAYGREIIGFTSTEELLRKVRYFLDHPAEAEAIRAAGGARVRRDHPWRTAWPRVLDELRR
jgi:spore maturation protein CgeB